MLQHRHVYPGLKSDKVLGFHAAGREHSKYPTAHAHIHDTREIADKAAPAPEEEETEDES